MKNKLFWIIGISLIVLIGITVIGHNYAVSNTSRYKGPVAADNLLPETLISDLEKYVKPLMRKMDVPGLSMVLVEDDQVIYELALGVRDLETKAPVTTHTLLGIASTTKSMTAVMIASLVDEGVIAWDMPLTDILPSFSLSTTGTALMTATPYIVSMTLHKTGIGSYFLGMVVIQTIIFLKEWSLRSVPKVLPALSLLMVILYLVFLSMFILYEQGMVSRTAPVIWEWLAILSSIVRMLAQSILLGRTDQGQ